MPKPTPRSISWGYIGEGGPERWGELDADYRLCASGQRQSPIDLTAADFESASNSMNSTNLENAAGLESFAVLERLEIDYHPMPLAVTNTGRTVRFDCVPGSSLTLGDRRFALKQFHFHCPSEHRFDGVAEAIELHFVHRAETGELAVLAVLLRAEAGCGDRAEVATLLDNLPPRTGDRIGDPTRTIDPRALLPDRLDRLYLYNGSLTTPPCSENVSWLICADPIAISTAQAERFSDAVAPNARPLQPRNRRRLFGSF